MNDIRGDTLSETQGRCPSPRQHRPSRLWRVLFGAPPHLYHWHLGWLFGRRLLALTYRGRRSGRTLTTVLEVLRHDRATGESVVASGYGPTAGWYLSIGATPALRIRTGRLDYAPSQRFLSAAEAREVIEGLARDHPLEMRLAPRMGSWMGCWAAPGPDVDGVELLASLPMVAFRPVTA